MTIRLGADIDLSAHEWIPIGSYTSFAGTFDGCGHTISGMRVPFTSYAGLFATISGGEIRNMALSSDCEVNGLVSGSLVGMAGSGIVENCVSEAAVSGQTAGGLIGDAGSTSVRACVFNGSVEAKELSPWYGTFSGTIADSVSVEGTQTVQMTIMPNGTDPNSVSISFIGYQPQELPAAANMNVILKDDSQLLDDVVVIGYGTVKKDDATGSVTAIKPDKISKGITTSPQDMITGKIAGVNVVSTGGTPGAGATIRVRGGSSLNASNDPLIVIDGLAMDNDGVKGMSNPLSLVNPNDIRFACIKRCHHHHHQERKCRFSTEG